MTPRWQVVVWDLDGTLVDTVGLIVASYQHAFQKVLGHPWDEAEIKSWIGQSLYGAIQRAVPEHADEVFREYTAWNVANTERMIAVYAGVPELLRTLKAAGVRMAIATSKRRQPAEWALQLCGLDGLAPLLVTHEDVDEHKPSPRPLLLALERMQANPEEAVYVGDAAVDVIAARNAGMQAIAVTWGAGTREAILAESPAAVADSPAELTKLLLGG